MFSTFKQRLLLGVYIFIILSIPVGAYLASQRQSTQSKASEPKKEVPKASPKPTLSPAKQLISQAESLSEATQSAEKETEAKKEQEATSSPTIASSFGPTLSFKASLEGRKDDQSGKMFVGIMEGALTANPKFLLSFNVDLPKSGEHSNLSLAGLTVGSKYTSLLKGAAQIATSSAFTLSPSVTNLNNGQLLNLLSGDLNDDNTVNTADYSIALKALGSTSTSSNWNQLVDFNKDGIINAFDISYIVKNMGKTGASGSWVSPLPKEATKSGGLTSPNSTSPPIGGPMGSTKGHWIWVPDL